MSDKSSIEWTDSTWNPTRGCTKVSAGCRNCYAEKFAERWRGVPGHPYEQGFDLRLVPEALELPLHWKKPRRIFVNSMSDLFHEDVPDEFIDQVFGVMAAARRHTFQVLTKRAQRMQRWFGYAPDRAALPNVWLGVSVEDQRAADERIPALLATPAAVRFLSCEPLLGPVELPMPKIMVGFPKHIDRDGHAHGAPLTLHWVIVGGESGPGARPCDVAWIRSLVEQCRGAGVPAFCKQLGANVQDRNDAGWDGCEPTDWPEHLVGEDRVEHDLKDTGYQGAPVRVHTRDRAGRNPDEWPADLRVREMPETTR